MSVTAAITGLLRRLVLPPRPDPARSRRIAEVRLVHFIRIFNLLCPLFLIPIRDYNRHTIMKRFN